MFYVVLIGMFVLFVGVISCFTTNLPFLIVGIGISFIVSLWLGCIAEAITKVRYQKRKIEVGNKGEPKV